ncbi:GNAT family N-acetyltransferase [Inquilinus sp. KBS0705]|nr:GNAT family N-acetyltransferase [Inquilinus sp. KBS0705]
MQFEKADQHKAEVIALLETQKLPAADLPALLDNFTVAVDHDGLKGVIGLEIYGSYGLLRSLAVDEKHRDKGIASGLLQQLETDAAQKGLKAIYLLTETAQSYFERKGYEHVARMDIAEAVKASSEFSHVCPQSAIAMVKYIN